MADIIVTILLILITALMIYKMYKEYQKSETLDEKVVFWLVTLIFVIPMIIYYVDRYDVISKFGWFENSSSDRWFSFFETYFSSLVSAIIGAVVLIVMTIHQLKLDRDKNLSDKRIQNAPIFRYEINNISVPTTYEYSVYNKIDGNPYSLFLNIENVGLNHARNIEFEVFDDVNKEGQKFKFDTQSFLKKDDCKLVRFIFNYKYDIKTQKNNNKKIKIIVTYEDLLNNEYSQNIDVAVEVTNKSGGQYGGYKLYIVSVKINNEEHCKKEVK